MKRAGLAAGFCAVATACVSGQEIYVDAYGDAEPMEYPAIVEEHIVRERVIERSVRADDDDGVVLAPRVYGWSYEMRPEDCGTFKYWNGEYCADARYEPPEND